jgi:hypothetical protein
MAVDIDGEQVDDVFDRQAERHDGIKPEDVPGGDVSAVGWGKHSPLSPGSLVVGAASDIGQGRVFTQSRNQLRVDY